MPVICFEGASAIGKTTTALAFKEICENSCIVPEVNELFVRPQNESAEWYFERQAERCRIAAEQSKTRAHVILDGDPFQPLWYNWAYDFKGWQNLDFIERFYQSEIQNKLIRFPDLYFIFSANEADLRKRKNGDSVRQRRGFEKHLQMIEPQRRYFEAMRSFSPDRVFFLKADSIESNVASIKARAAGEGGESESKDLFAKMIVWLRANKAREIDQQKS